MLARIYRARVILRPLIPYLPLLLFVSIYLLRNLTGILALCERSGDYALIALQTERARNLELIEGPYSRFHFRHPGPVYFYYYALTQLIMPEALSLQARMALAQFALNLVFMFWAVYQLRVILRGPISLWTNLFTLCALAYADAARPHLWHDIWGPSTLFTSSLCYLVSSALVLNGNLQGLLPLVLSGGLAISNHLGAAPILGPLGLFSFGMAIRRRWHVPLLRSERTVLLASGVIAAAFITPPLIDLLANRSRSNFAAIAHFLMHRSPAPPGQSFTDAVFLDSALLVAPLHATFEPGRTFELILVVVGIAISIVLLRSRAEWRALGVVVLASVPLLLCATLGIEGRWYHYLLMPAYAVGTIMTLLFAATVYELTWLKRLPWAERTLTAVLAMLIIVVLLRSNPTLTKVCSPRAEQIISKLEAGGARKYRLYIAANDSWGAASLLALTLYRAKISFCVQTEWAFLFSKNLACNQSGSNSDADRDSALVVAPLAARRPIAGTELGVLSRARIFLENKPTVR